MGNLINFLILIWKIKKNFGNHLEILEAFFGNFYRHMSDL